jgi:hypothetical protein
MGGSSGTGYNSGITTGAARRLRDGGIRQLSSYRPPKLAGSSTIRRRQIQQHGWQRRLVWDHRWPLKRPVRVHAGTAQTFFLFWGGMQWKSRWTDLCSRSYVHWASAYLWSSNVIDYTYWPTASRSLSPTHMTLILYPVILKKSGVPITRVLLGFAQQKDRIGEGLNKDLDICPRAKQRRR